jgi:hypothetical protein
MATSKPKVQGNCDKAGSSSNPATIVAPGNHQHAPVAAEDENYPGGRVGLMLWLSGVVILSGYLLWDLVTALLFR